MIHFTTEQEKQLYEDLKELLSLTKNLGDPESSAAEDDKIIDSIILKSESLQEKYTLFE